MEWSIPDSSTPVRQGDILISRDVHADRPIQEICLVITADCDISKGKFGRQLACLRVIRFEEYLRTVWAERKLRKLEKEEGAKLRGQVAKWHTMLLGSDSQLSQDAVVAWVRKEKPEAICNHLKVPEDHRKKVVAALTSFRAALTTLQAEGDKFEQLVAFRAAILARDVDTCGSEILTSAQNDKLPDDVFLLPNLPQLDVGAAVVMLREIVSVMHEAVCYRSADAVTSDMFLRLGRLEPTFKYAVSQAFAVLYSKIGLPEDYENRCKAAISGITQLDWRKTC